MTAVTTLRRQLKIFRVSAVALCLAFSKIAFGADLLEIYNLAVENDLTLRTAQSINNAELLTEDITKASVLPSVTLGATLTESRKKSSIRPFPKMTEESSRNELTLSVPLYSPATSLALKEARRHETLAGLRLDKAKIELHTRVVHAFFNVLAAEDNFETARRESNAIDEFRQQSESRFQVGVGTTTDVRIAEARASLANANLIAASNAIELAWQELTEIIHDRPSHLSRLAESLELAPPDPDNLQIWIDLAMDSNMDIKIQREAVEISRINIDLADRDSSFFSSLTATVKDHHGDVPNNYERSNVMLRIGKTFSAAGYGTKRKRRAAYYYQAEKDRLGAVQRQVEMNVSNTFHNVHNLINQVVALKFAVTANQSALTATENAFRLGTQTSLDVLNAQRDVFQTTRDLQAARYDYLLSLIQLKQLAGTLGFDDIKQLNDYLK